MALQAVQLRATPDAWRLFSARRVDPAFRGFAKKVWERDHYTCQYCGFQAKQHQEVVNWNHNYRVNRLANMLTACCFCTQCFFIEAIGKGEYGGGTLIYLPELTQSELDGLCHVLFCAMANATNYRVDAQNVYRILKQRSQYVEEQLGSGMSDPAVLGQMLVEAQTSKANASRGDALLKDLRLLPSRASFSQEIDDWAAAALEELSGSAA